MIVLALALAASNPYADAWFDFAYASGHCSIWLDTVDLIEVDKKLTTDDKDLTAALKRAFELGKADGLAKPFYRQTCKILLDKYVRRLKALQ